MLVWLEHSFVETNMKSSYKQAQKQVVPEKTKEKNFQKLKILSETSA
jgi:hypothetical protein